MSVKRGEELTEQLNKAMEKSGAVHNMIASYLSLIAEELINEHRKMEVPEKCHLAALLVLKYLQKHNLTKTTKALTAEIAGEDFSQIEKLETEMTIESLLMSQTPEVIARDISINESGSEMAKKPKGKKKKAGKKSPKKQAEISKIAEPTNEENNEKPIEIIPEPNVESEGAVESIIEIEEEPLPQPLQEEEDISVSSSESEEAVFDLPDSDARKGIQIVIMETNDHEVHARALEVDLSDVEFLNNQKPVTFGAQNANGDWVWSVQKCRVKITEMKAMLVNEWQELALFATIDNVSHVTVELGNGKQPSWDDEWVNEVANRRSAVLHVELKSDSSVLGTLNLPIAAIPIGHSDFWLDLSPISIGTVHMAFSLVILDETIPSRNETALDKLQGASDDARVEKAASETDETDAKEDAKPVEENVEPTENDVPDKSGEKDQDEENAPSSEKEQKEESESSSSANDEKCSSSEHEENDVKESSNEAQKQEEVLPEDVKEEKATSDTEKETKDSEPEPEPKPEPESEPNEEQEQKEVLPGEVQERISSSSSSEEEPPCAQEEQTAVSVEPENPAMNDIEQPNPLTQIMQNALDKLQGASDDAHVEKAASETDEKEEAIPEIPHMSSENEDDVIGEQLHSSSGEVPEDQLDEIDDIINNITLSSSEIVEELEPPRIQLIDAERHNNETLENLLAEFAEGKDDEDILSVLSNDVQIGIDVGETPVTTDTTDLELAKLLERSASSSDSDQ